MAELYKRPDVELPKFDTFKSYDEQGNEISGQIPQGNPLYNLPAAEQESALAELQKPPTGEELAYALSMRPDFEKTMTIEEFQRYDDYMRTVETNWVEGIMTGAGMVVDEIGKGLSAMWADDEKLKRAIPTFAEGFARGTRDMYGLLAQSADPQSPLFKFKALLTGDGTPEERFQQFKEAREFNRRSLSIMNGEQNVTDIDPDLINPEMAQALSYVADPSWLVPFVGQAGKAAGLSMKSVGLARLGEQIATVGAYAEHLKRLAAGGALKVAGAPLSILGKAATNTIEWGADKAAAAFEFGTGMAYQDARRVVRDAGLYGGTLFRIPYMSTISDSYIAGWGAAGVGDAMGMLGDVIQRRQRGVFSYAEMALAQGGDVLSPQAKALLRIINQADPFLSYGYAAMDGMVTGAVVGGALGYASARGEGAAQGIGMGGVMGAGGALMGRAWAGMAREGGIIHQRVQTEMKFVKEALKDIDPQKLQAIETLEQLAGLHGQDLSWQILGMLKLVPDLKLEVLDSAGFEQLRRQQKEGRLNGENENDPLVGLDLNDPADIKKLRQIYNFEGVVVQKTASGETTLYINADHYRKNTFGHEMFHGIMRMSPFGDEFVKDLREKFLGRVTPEGIEMPGVIEPSKMRGFMERYIRAVYSNNPDQMEQRLQALDAAIKAYETDGTLIPGQDPSDARPVLDILAEEAGAYYFSHMIAGKDMDWLYRGGDLGGLRQVFDDAKEGILNFIESKFRSNGMDFDFAKSATINEGFLRGGQDGGKRIRVGALDALMAEIVRRQAGTQEGRSLDISQMNGEQQRRFRERNGLGDVLQPRKGGGMDARRRTAAEESARSKQMVDALRGMDQSQRTSQTIIEKNGDVTIYGDLSNAELDQLVRVGAMMLTEAARYRMFRDTIANRGKGTNVFGASYVGESYEVGEGKAPPRLRRSRGDRVPVTHREFTPIELRTEIKLTKGGKGKATIVVTGLDVKNADMRLRELWFREDVQKTWSGDYNAFAADFYRYLQNASDPKGVPSAEFFGGGQQGSYKRNVFHEAFGAALREGETPFNEPSPTYKGAEGRGEKFVIHSMTLGSIYDVKMRDRNVPYDHSVAYDRVRRNWSPADMRREVMPDGEKLTHEETGFSFLRGPSGRWRAYDEHRRVVGIANDVEQAAKLGQKAWEAKEAAVAKEIKNFSVADKTEITAKGWAPAFFSAVEKFVKSGAITPNMSPEQVWAKIRKANYAGIRVDELRFLGLEARLLGGDNQHFQNAREMDAKVKELFAYSQRFASEDPAKLARVQEVAANLRREQMKEQAKGEALRREEQAKDGFASGKPIGQAGLDALNKHLQDRAVGLRMVDEGNGYASYVMDGTIIQGTYKILTARSNQRTGVTGHFGDDVVVHIRVDERMDPVTGKAALVVHEIQANNAEEKSAVKNPEVLRRNIERNEELAKDAEEEIARNKRLAGKPQHKLVNQLSIDPINGPALGLSSPVDSSSVMVAKSKYERERIGVAIHNASVLIKSLTEADVEHRLGDRAIGKPIIEGDLVFKPSDELKKLIAQEFEQLKKDIVSMLAYVHKNSEFEMVGPSEANHKYALRKALIEILDNSPFLSTHNRVRNSYNLRLYEPFTTGGLGAAESQMFGAEVILVGEAVRRAMLGLSDRQSIVEMFKPEFKQESAQKAFDDLKDTMRIVQESRMKVLTGVSGSFDNYVDAISNVFGFRLSEINLGGSLEGYKGYYQFDNTIQGTGSQGPQWTGSFYQVLVRDMILGSSAKDVVGEVGDIKVRSPRLSGSLADEGFYREAAERYNHIEAMAGRELLETTVKEGSISSSFLETEQTQKFAKLEQILKNKPTGMLDAKDLGFVGNFAFNAIRRDIVEYGKKTEAAKLRLADIDSEINRDKMLLKGSSGELIMQTPQDWVVIGLKMAIRRAAEVGVDTIVFTDHTGAPTKCGMEYLSAASLYTQIIPTLGNGFLRQYNTKIEMPVLPKVYRFGGVDDNGKVSVLGDNGGVSWQEQLGMRATFVGARLSNGSISYRVNYIAPSVRQIQQQDVHMAQMKNNPRLRITEDLKRQALDEGFASFAPSEGGEVPPREIPKGAKSIDEFGKEPNLNSKNKRAAGKLVGMYFRERETGRVFQLTYTGRGDAMFFDPVDMLTEREAIEANRDSEPEKAKEFYERFGAERKMIRTKSGTSGLGYRGIEDQVKAAFDAYSKTEFGKEQPPKPVTIDTDVIRTNADAIKDTLTSLDGLSLTKDDTFRLFGRRTAKGKTLGLIDEINAEVDKAKAGEAPDMDKIEEKLTELEEMRDEMQEKQDNTPEGLQETEAYQNREENIDAINEAIDEVRGLMEPPKGGEGEVRNMSVVENTGALPDNPYRGAADALSTMELWAVAAKAGRLGPVAKMNHKLVTPEVLKTVEWLLTNDNSGITQNRPKSFATIADALKWVRETSLKQYKGPNRKWAPASLTKSFKDAYLASSAILGEPTKKPRSTNVEPKAKDGASFDEWFEWARKKRVNGKSVATARNALKFIAEMPSEGYYKAVAQMLLAIGPAGFLDMQLHKTGRGFMRYGSGGSVGKIAISLRGGGKSGTDVSLKGRNDNYNDSTVDVVIEEIMHAAQMTNSNYGPMKILKGLGSRGVSWKMGALKLIAQTEADIKGKTYNQLDAGTKELLMAARLAKLILEGTKGIEALTEGSGKIYDLHEALFGRVVSQDGVWRNEGDPSKGGGAGKKLRFRFRTKEQVGTNKASEVNGYHFGNVAEFLVGLFADPNLARLYFDRPPVDLSSLTPKGDPLRTSWRNLASQMIAVAMDFFNGLFGSKKQNYGSQLVEETVVMLQRQAETFKNMDPVRDIDARIGTNELGFTREPAANEPTPATRQRGRQPTPGGEPIPMGMNTGETGLAVVDGQGARRGNELGPATPVVEGEARPIPKPGRGPIPRIGARQDLPAQQYGYPRPSTPPPSMTITWSTGDAMAGQSILTSTAGYMVVLVKNKWRVYNPEREIIAVFSDVERAKELADKRARQRK